MTDKSNYRITFDVYHSGEYAAGIRSYSERVTVLVESDPGGIPGEFAAHMRDALTEWFDGARLTLVEEVQP